MLIYIIWEVEGVSVVHHEEPSQVTPDTNSRETRANQVVCVAVTIAAAVVGRAVVQHVLAPSLSQHVELVVEVVQL